MSHLASLNIINVFIYTDIDKSILIHLIKKTRGECGCTLYSKQDRQRWRRSSKRLICGTDRSDTHRSNSPASAFFNTHRKHTSSVLLHSAERALHWRPAWRGNKQKHIYTTQRKTQQSRAWLDITSSSLFGTCIYRGCPYTPKCIINTQTHMMLISSDIRDPLIFTNGQETM